MRHVLFLLLAFSLLAMPHTTLADSPGRRIALSFDDAPRGHGPLFSGDERAALLIDALAKAEAGPVAFFIKTKGAQGAAGRARVQRYATAGHLIANHTHSHQWLRRTALDEYLTDIDRAEQLLAGIDNRRPWFRYPYLDEGRPVEKRDAAAAALVERGLLNAYVTVDNYDWYIEEQWRLAKLAGKSTDMDALRKTYVGMLTGAVEFYDQLAIEHLNRSPIHVLLLHENDIAALFVGDLIMALRDAGWTIVSPDEAYADALATMTPKTLSTGQGRVAGLAVDNGVDPRTLSHFAIEEAQIDAQLLAAEVFRD